MTKQRGKPKNKTDEPNDTQLRSAERYAKKLEKKWYQDIADIRKQLSDAEEIGYDGQ